MNKPRYNEVWEPPKPPWYEHLTGMLFIIVLMLGLVAGILWGAGYMIGLGLVAAGCCS